MKKYLIACDLDGTLLNGKSTLDKESIQTLQTLQSLGHRVVIATGRPYRACVDFHKEIGLDTPLISDNGGSIENPVNDNFKKVRLTIPKRVVEKIFLFAQHKTFTAFYSVDNGLYVYKKTDKMSWLYHENDETFFVEGPFTNEKLPEPSGIMYVISIDFKAEFEKFLAEECENIIAFRHWGSDYKNAIYEVYQKRTSKAEALTLVRQFYDIDESNFIAFGDGLNDIEMIEVASTGIAMANAQHELKVKADIVLKETNDQLGVSNYLKTFFDI